MDRQLHFAGWSLTNAESVMSMMTTVSQKKCSVCGESFGCGVNSPDQRCWCNDLPRVAIVQGDDCRCPKCLSEIVLNQGRADKLATSATELIEGVDYYMEGSSFVFTAMYHLKRGYCCESGCRHCPYSEAGESVESKLLK